MYIRQANFETLTQALYCYLEITQSTDFFQNTYPEEHNKMAV